MINTLYSIFQKWSEKGSVYIISDTHFGDEDRDVMGYSITEEEQIKIITSLVHKNDTLIHLGDVGDPKYIEKIKGYKVLIMGNHDQSSNRFSTYFDEVYTGPLFISDKILLSHEPVYGLPYVFNIHGHDHNQDNKGDENHLNLASNVCGYNPVNLGKLIKEGILASIDDIHRQTIDNASERKAIREKISKISRIHVEEVRKSEKKSKVPEKYIPLICSVMDRIKFDLSVAYWNVNQKEMPSPFDNNGNSYKNDVFTVKAYSWDEDNYLPNFQYKGLDVYWYKHSNRGVSAEIDGELTLDFLSDMYKECIEAINKDFYKNHLIN